MSSSGFFNADKAEQTQRLNKISQYPIAGQVIGVVTVAINVAKVALDILAIIATLPFRMLNFSQAPALFKRATVLNRNSVIGLSHHIRYIAIGVLRFMPYVGAKVLHDLKVAPQRPKVWSYNPEAKRIQFSAFHQEQNIKLARGDLIVSAVSNIPFVGPVCIIPALYNTYEKYSKATLAAYACTAMLPLGGLMMLLAGIVLKQEDTVHPSFPPARQIPIQKDSHTALQPLNNCPVDQQWFDEENFPPLTANRAAMVLGDTRVHKTSFEGSLPEDSLFYWKDIVNQNAEGPIPAGLSIDEKTTLEKILTDMEEAQSLIRQMKPEKLHEHILSKLETDKRCYIPIQYLQRGGVPGHASALALEKKADGSISFYLLNAGEGSERNPLIEVNGKNLRSYRTPKRIFHSGVLDTASLPELIVSWANRVSMSKPMSTGRILCYLDLVSFEDKSDKLEQAFAVTSQRSGTCGEQMTRLVMRDFFLQGDRKEGIRKYKRMIAHGKLYAIRAMKKTIEAPFSLLVSLHDAAAHTFLQDYRKGYITQNEVLAIGDLMVKTRSSLEKSRKQEDLQPCLQGDGVVKSPPNIKTRGSIRRAQYIDDDGEIDSDIPGNDSCANMIRLEIEEPDAWSRGCSQFAMDPRNFLKEFAPPNDKTEAELKSLSAEKKIELIDMLRNVNNKFPIREIFPGNCHEKTLHLWESLAHINFLYRELPEMGMAHLKLDMPVDSLLEGVVCHLGHQQKRKDALVAYFRKEAARDVPALFNYLKTDPNEFPDTFENQYENYMKGLPLDPNWKGLFDYLRPFYDEVLSKGLPKGWKVIDVMRDLIGCDPKLATDDQKKRLGRYRDYRDLAYAKLRLTFHGDGKGYVDIRHYKIREQNYLLANYDGDSSRINTKDLYFGSSRSEPTLLMNPLVDERGSENSLLANVAPVEQLTHHVSADFRAASAYPSARIAAIIDWVKVNGNLLGRSDVQNLIEKGLFTGAGYGSGIKHEPALHEQFKALIRDQLKPVKFSRLSEILFLIKIGFCIETHVEGADDAAWRQWKGELDKALLEVVACARLYEDDQFASERSIELLSHAFTLRGLIYSMGGKQTREDLAESFSSLFIGSYYDKASNFLMVTDEAKRRHSELVKPFLSAPDPAFKDLMSATLKKLLGCRNDDKVAASLVSGKILKNGVLLERQKPITKVPRYVKQILGEYFYTMERRGPAYYTPDNRFKYEADTLWMHHKDKWWSYKNIEHGDEVQSVMGSDRHLWIDKDHAFIVTGRDLTVEIAGYKGAYAVRNGPDGSALYHTTITPSSELSLFLSGLGQSLNNCSFWGKAVVPEPDAPATPTAVELSDWNNLMLYQDGAKIRCKGYEGYALSPSQAHMDGHHLPGVIHLTHDNNPDDRIVLIKYSQDQRHPFDCRGQKVEISDAEKEHQHYFTYAYDPKSGLFTSQEKGGYLYLASTYLSLGMYDRAHLYLSRSPQLVDLKTVGPIIDKIYKLKDESPYAVAFALRLAYRMVQDQRLSRKNLSFSDDEKKVLGSLIEQYLKYSHSDDEKKVLGNLIEQYLKYSHHKGTHFSKGLLLEDFELESLFDSIEETKHTLLEGFKEFFSSRPQALLEFCRIKGISSSLSWFGAFNHDVFSFFPSDSTKLLLSEGKVPTVDVQTEMPEVTIKDVSDNFHFFFHHYRNVGREITYPEEQDRSSPYLGPMGYHPSDALLHRLWAAGEDEELVSLLRMARYYPAVFHDVPDREIVSAALNFVRDFKKVEKETAISSTEPLRSLDRPAGPSRSLPQLDLKLVEKEVSPDSPILSQLYGELFTAPANETSKNALPPRLAAKLGEVASSSYFKHTRKTEVDLKAKIDSSLKLARQQHDELVSKIETKLRPQRSESTLQRLKEWEESKQPPSYRDLLLAIASGSFKKLQDKAPYLSQSDADTIAEWGTELMLIGSRIDQMKEALDSAQRGDTASVGTVLYKKRSYNPYTHPMLLYYEYATGHILRDKPDQAQLLIGMFKILFKEDKTEADVAELRRFCFEFQAGGGKTKVISVILAARAIAEGKLPIFFSLPQLFDIANQDLHEVLTSLFEHNVCHIDLSLQDTVTDSKVRHLLATLKQKKEQGVCVVMTPETFHTLNLAWQEALIAADTKLINELAPLRRFLKEEGLFLIDESHRNVDPLLIANKAVGAPVPIDESERNLIILAYKILAGREREELNLNEIVNITSNRQAQVPEGKKAKALATLSEALIDSLQLSAEGADAKQIGEVRQWVKDKSMAAPEWLQSWMKGTPQQQSQARLIAYTRGLILVVLPHCLSQVGEMDYGQTSEPDDFVVSPRDHKNPVQAKFESVDVAAALTIQDVLVNGVSKHNAMILLLQQLVDEAKNWRKAAPSIVPAICEKFLSWQKEGLPIDLETIDSDWLQNQSHIAMMIRRIGNEPELIEKYLKFVVLPRILVFPEKITSTGKELVTASWASVLFSATMGRKELYPDMEIEENYKPDTQFLGQVFSRALVPHNRKVHYHPSSTAYELFKRLGGEMAQTNGVLDVGFWSKGETSEEWARAFNRYAAENKQMMNSFHGALYFKKGRDGSKALYLWPVGAANPQKLPSTNLKKLKLADKKLFCIYAADETTGTDLYLPPDARMIVTVGESTGSNEAAQAVMRMRGFLKDPIVPDESQKTLWVVLEEMRQKISAFGKDDQLESVILWMIDNQENREREAILARAYQEIDGVVRAEIQKRVDIADGSRCKAQIQKKHKKAFLYNLARSVMGMYGKENKPVPTREVLEAYAKEYMKQASMEASEKLMAEINRIITQTERLIKTVASSTHSLTNATRQANHSVAVAQQQQREQSRSRQQFANEQLAAVEQYAIVGGKADLKNLPLEDDAFFTPMLPEFVKSTFRTAPNARNFLKNGMYYKSVKFFLLVEDAKGKRGYIGVSYDDALAYQEQLRGGYVKEGLKIALFSAGGVLVQNGRGDAGIQTPVDSLQKDKSFTHELSALALYNGRIQLDEWLKDLGKRHPDELRLLVNTLKARHFHGDELFHLEVLDKVTGGKSALMGDGSALSITVTSPANQGVRDPSSFHEYVNMPTSSGLVVKRV